MEKGYKLVAVKSIDIRYDDTNKFWSADICSMQFIDNDYIPTVEFSEEQFEKFNNIIGTLGKPILPVIESPCKTIQELFASFKELDNSYLISEILREMREVDVFKITDHKLRARFMDTYTLLSMIEAENTGAVFVVKKYYEKDE